MQTITSIATSHRGKTTSYPNYLIVGSTTSVNLSAVLELLGKMEAHMLPLGESQDRQSLPSHPEGLVAAVEEAGKAIESVGRPALIPASFDSGIESVEQLTERLDDAALLLFYERPEPLLLEAMAKNEDPSAALQTWSTVSRFMLEIIHENRRRAVLFDIESAFTNDAVFEQICRERFGLKEWTEEGLPRASQRAVSEIHRLIASQMVIQSPDVQELLNELEATAAPPAVMPAIPKVNCEAALTEWRGRVESDELKEENELLLLQLHQVQEELESYYLKLGETEKQLASKDTMVKRLSKSLEEQKSKHDAAQTQVKKLERELADARRTLKRRDKSIEDKSTKYKAARAQVKELKRELAETRNTLTSIRNSRSWRLTKPLRGVRGFLYRRPKKHGAG